ncbi:MAG: site-specific DNA-methyltransferase, partial [Candidatus Aminicenantes bacterium]|nr:site-specific DNA-methyltransferase [Candidatus Aminicenantes bacterium]
MATGIPSKNGNSTGGAIRLTYPGKLPQQGILSEPSVSEFEVAHKTASINRLYCGDNLAALKSLIDDTAVRGKVTLVY